MCAQRTAWVLLLALEWFKMVCACPIEYTVLANFDPVFWWFVLSTQIVQPASYSCGSRLYFSPKRTLKGILHPKIKILSSFTHPQVVANLYEFLYSAEHKGRYFEERLEPNSLFGTIDFHSRTNYYYGSQCSNRSSKYIPLSSAGERNSHRFATTWGWVNDDSIFIFGCSIPLK